jgi:pyruvate kinase
MTDDVASAREVLRLGCDAFRFPASKFDAAVLAEQAAGFAAMAAEESADVEFFLDLPGSKVRLTNNDGFLLAGLDRVRIDFAPTPADRAAEVPVLGVTGASFGPLEPGDVLVTGDGEDAMVVEEAQSDHCMVRPLTSGELGRRRGITVIGKATAHQSLTERDLAALAAIGDTVFSAVILSFVEDAATVVQARQQMLSARPSRRPLPAIVAKIETRRGAANLGDIAGEADAILLGRGDLLLDVGEVDFYDVGREVMKNTPKTGRPIIVGTQIMASLSDSWLPNRSELAYACHLIEKNVDAIMLSFETTIGRQPHRTVEILTHLIDRYGKRTDGRLLASR